MIENLSFETFDISPDIETLYRLMSESFKRNETKKRITSKKIMETIIFWSFLSVD